MARYLTDLHVSLVDEAKNIWRVSQNFVYYSDTTRNNIIVVPEGTETDFASVPRLPLIYTMLGNIGLKAAVIHDYMYESRVYDKATADNVFYEALRVSGVPAIKAWAMYVAVSLFGQNAYDRVQERKLND